MSESMLLTRLKTGLIAALLLPLALTHSIASAKGYAPWVGNTLRDAPCKGRAQGYCPYDYTQRLALAHNLEVVENFHFTPPVERLERGENGSIPGDIDYTLSAWPNHHRALNSISRYDLGYPSKKHQPMIPVECYFQRAIGFSPNDGVSRLLYGIYLHKSGHYDLALTQYEQAEDLSPHDPQIKYNLGLLLVDMEQYERAEGYARALYAKDFPLMGLKRQLQDKGFLKQAGSGQNPPVN